MYPTIIANKFLMDHIIWKWFIDNILTFSSSCRFVFGSDHGRLKFGPPEEHSPVIEALPPKEKIRIEPCFFFGDLSKNIISGPTEICEYQPFVPNPVSTSHVSMHGIALFLETINK